MKRAAIVISAVVGACALALLAASSRTPPVTDDEGRPVPGSVAELRKLKLGGVDQWILVRGYSRSNPVLLILHGGPGLPTMFLHRKFAKRLEKRFLVVHWDQRGAGKSYRRGIPAESLSAKRLLGDLEELVSHLRREFGDRKIYLLGHSWGSYLGIIFARRHPELLRAYIGVGQITDPDRAAEMADRFILERAREAGEQRAINQLGSRGAVARQKWLLRMGGVLYGMNSYGPIIREAFAAPEYSFLDALRVAPGFRFSSTHMKADALKGSVSDEVTELQVPVYFFQGRHDYVTPAALLQQYAAALKAPRKKIVYFERSAHYPFLEEPEKFAEALFQVLEETEPAGEKEASGAGGATK